MPPIGSCVLCLLSFGVFITSGIQHRSDRYALRGKDMRVRQLHTSLEVRPCYSMISCVAICNQMEGCLSASYKEKLQRCAISSLDTLTDDTLMATNFSDWISMAKVVYPVYQIESPLGPNQATFTDATQLCADRNTVVASPTDLLDARSRGYHHCACGWMSDQTNGFVIQNDSLSCNLGTFQTSIIYCNATEANVYCYL